MATVFSEKKWNDTGIDLVKGKKYRYSANGEWIDLSIRTDADGFTKWYMAVMNWSKRNPGSNWFRLMGAVDKIDEYTIEMGKEGVFVAPESGRLWAYANDAPFAYGNNCGSVELLVEEI